MLKSHFGAIIYAREKKAKQALEKVSIKSIIKKNPISATDQICAPNLPTCAKYLPELRAAVSNFKPQSEHMLSISSRTLTLPDRKTHRPTNYHTEFGTYLPWHVSTISQCCLEEENVVNERKFFALSRCWPVFL